MSARLLSLAVLDAGKERFDGVGEFWTGLIDLAGNSTEIYRGVG
jgi:hypothetical protein